MNKQSQMIQMWKLHRIQKQIQKTIEMTDMWAEYDYYASGEWIRVFEFKARGRI